MELGLPPTVGVRGAGSERAIALTEKDDNRRSHIGEDCNIGFAIAIEIADRECSRILVHCRGGGGMEGPIALTEKNRNAAVIGIALGIGATRLGNSKIRLAIPVKVRGDDGIRNFSQDYVLLGESQRRLWVW